MDTKKHAATLTKGSPGVLHGSYSYLLQDEEGQIIDPHSISAGWVLGSGSWVLGSCLAQRVGQLGTDEFGGTSCCSTNLTTSTSVHAMPPHAPLLLLCCHALSLAFLAPSSSAHRSLDYPGIGPEHAFLKDSGRAEYHAVTDQEALDVSGMSCEESMLDCWSAHPRVVCRQAPLCHPVCACLPARDTFCTLCSWQVADHTLIMTRQSGLSKACIVYVKGPVGC